MQQDVSAEDVNFLWS